ncbi:MAG: hypothetical protein ACRBCT_05295 [Alphaproteobacteria bacterium]
MRWFLRYAIKMILKLTALKGVLPQVFKNLGAAPSAFPPLTTALTIYKPNKNIPTTLNEAPNFKQVEDDYWAVMQETKCLGC